jgi:hypothetical protein
MMCYTAIKDSQKHNYITSGFYWADVVYKKTLTLILSMDCSYSVGLTVSVRIKKSAGL